MIPELRLIPTPRKILPGVGTARLPSELGYRGPMPETAARILAPALLRAHVAWRHDAERVITAAINPRLPLGHHVIELSPGVSGGVVSASILAADEEPLRHALVTLAQLIHRFGRDLPAIIIEDSPVIETRGVMLDISRDRVPTMEALRGFVDRMELLKLNHFQLYTEHTFAYAGHDEVWRHSSPMMPDEVRELDAYCRERGVELAANQNCLGHLHRWLLLPRYEPLAEIPSSVKEWRFETDDGRAFTKSGPHSLNPTDPRSLALIEDLLGQLLPCFASQPVNIGCDEAFDIGQGRSRQEVEQRGRAAVYFDWLKRVDEIVKRHGKRSMFWADIAWRHPERASDVPEGAAPLVWGYEADSFDRLDAAVESMRSAGLRPWFCPGTSSWLSITGRSVTRSRNVRAAAARAAAEPRSGLLCCDWGDRGHRQQWPIGLMGIAQAAHESWTGADASRPFDARAAGAVLFGDEASENWIEAIGAADAELSARASLRNTNALFQELHRPMRELPTDVTRHGTMEEWQAVRDRIEALRDGLAALRVDDLVRAELEHTASVAIHSAEKAIVCRACLDEPGRLPRGAARVRLAADLASLMEEHRALWTRRNRPGGMIDSCAHYERVIEDYSG